MLHYYSCTTSDDYALHENITPEKICRFNAAVCPFNYNIIITLFKRNNVSFFALAPDDAIGPAQQNIIIISKHKVFYYYCGGHDSVSA